MNNAHFSFLNGQLNFVNKQKKLILFVLNESISWGIKMKVKGKQKRNQKKCLKVRIMVHVKKQLFFFSFSMNNT